MVNLPFKPLYIETSEGTILNPDITDEEFAAFQARTIADSLVALEEAVASYERSYIYGSAIGMLVLGVLANAPKCLAIKQWIVNLWLLYYDRKALVTADYDPTLYDFSPAGPMPYSIPELMQEVGLIPPPEA